ncbi:hypothetical protein JXA12_02795 [Candidatus Woesearchaeota archaeon]|nr:hypothetical protein [Candidatus Woesearchaeota archaeon]
MSIKRLEKKLIDEYEDVILDEIKKGDVKQVSDWVKDFLSKFGDYLDHRFMRNNVDIGGLHIEFGTHYRSEHHLSIKREVQSAYQKILDAVKEAGLADSLNEELRKR